MDVKLKVGNIAPATTAHELEALFAQAGAVVSVQLHGDGDGQATRSAQITMANRAAAQKAIDQFHKTELAGSTLAVSFAPVRGTAAGQPGQLGAFGQAKPNKSGPTRGGYQSSLGAFGSGKSAPTPPRRRGGSVRH